jgi:hypothetical protein
MVSRIDGVGQQELRLPLPTVHLERHGHRGPNEDPLGCRLLEDLRALLDAELGSPTTRSPVDRQVLAAFKGSSQNGRAAWGPAVR